MSIKCLLDSADSCLKILLISYPWGEDDMKKEATQSDLNWAFGIIASKGHLVRILWMLVCPTQRSLALFREGKPFFKKMDKPHFQHESNACYWACCIMYNEMRCIKLVSNPENSMHWKYENKLAYELLNWEKLKKTWKDTEIFIQAGLCVKNLIIIYQQI